MGVWLVRDGQDVSTAELIRLIRLIAMANGKRTPVFPVPPKRLAFCARAVGKRALYEKLVGSLRVNDCETRASLKWKPPLTLNEGIVRCF
jgi:hypothetical protein